MSTKNQELSTNEPKTMPEQIEANRQAIALISDQLEKVLKIVEINSGNLDTLAKIHKNTPGEITITNKVGDHLFLFHDDYIKSEVPFIDFISNLDIRFKESNAWIIGNLNSLDLRFDITILKIGENFVFEGGTNIDVNNKKIIDVATPTNLKDAANKEYVDAQIELLKGENK